MTPEDLSQVVTIEQSSFTSGWSERSFRAELDIESSIVLVMVAEDDGSEHDYQFDFDPVSGRYEFSERDLLERDFGEEWVDEMEAKIEELIARALAQSGE